MSDSTARYIIDSECDTSDDSEHHIKFNSGNPLCIDCGRYVPGPPRIILPAGGALGHD